MKVLNFGLGRLGDVNDFGTDFPVNDFGGGDLPPEVSSFDSGFMGDPGAVAGAGAPLDPAVHLPAGASVEDAINDFSAGMVAGEQRVFVGADGATETVVAVDAEPALPDLAKLYKIGSQVYRYVMQQQPGGGTALVKKPVA